MTQGDGWDEPDMTEREPESSRIQQFTSLRMALADALEETPHLRRDRAMIALAFRYADLIDDASDRVEESEDEEQARDLARMVTIIAKIGPRLEATLASLGMAPGARPQTRGGDPDGRPDPARAALDSLYVTGAPPPGIDPAAFVDPSVTAADTGD